MFFFPFLMHDLYYGKLGSVNIQRLPHTDLPVKWSTKAYTRRILGMLMIRCPYQIMYLMTFGFCGEQF